MKIYTVIGSASFIYDNQTWTVASYTEKEMAELHRNKATEFTESLKSGKNPYDLNMLFDCTYEIQ